VQIAVEFVIRALSLTITLASVGIVATVDALTLGVNAGVSTRKTHSKSCHSRESGKPHFHKEK
jgi:hypothetical protein